MLHFAVTKTSWLSNLHQLYILKCDLICHMNFRMLLSAGFKKEAFVLPT